MIWVNVDKPLRSCTIHSSECVYVLKKQETRYKGVGKIKRDGGWMPFETLEEAYKFCKEKFPNYIVKKHC